MSTVEELANARYWESDLGVNQIIEELGLSKSRLYEAIRPIPAGSPCPECGEERVYPNRTARDRDQPVCPQGCLEEEEAFEEDALEADPRTLLAGLAIGCAVAWLLFRTLRR